MSCKLCGGDLLTQVSHRDAKSSEPLNVSICCDCGLIQQVPVPTDAELEKFYAYRYRSEYKNTITPKPRHVYRAGLVALSRLEFLAAHGIRDGKLLDIGAGGGEFVYLTGRSGFEASGVDPNLGYAEYARAEYGVLLHSGDLAEVSERSGVVTMFHVMEHLPSPLAAFENLWSIIEPGGTLFVEVPDIESKCASPNNIFFRAHIHYFCRATLTACASRHFEVIVTDNSSNLRVLFRRRDTPVPLVLPTAGEVEQVQKRLKKKGWVEYLFAGRGLLKPCSRIKKRAAEASIGNKCGRDILDQLAANRGVGRLTAAPDVHKKG